MTWNYAYTPSIWPSVLTVLLLIALAVYSGRRRSVPGATPFMVACLFAAGWAAISVIEYAAQDLSTKIFWVKVAALLQLPSATAVTCFILEYTWPGRWLTRRNLALLSIPCLLASGLALTNDIHGLVWRSFAFEGSVQPQLGPVGWLSAAYPLVVLAIVNILVLSWLFLHSPQHRSAVVVMLIGLLGGHALYLLEKVNILHSVLPLDLLGMAFEFLMYAIVLFGFRILDPILLARQTAIEQLHSGILVLDPQGKVVDLNPAACAMFGASEKRLLGRQIQDLLPACAGLIGDLQAAGKGRSEISLASGSQTRDYQLDASDLNDWRGLAVGRLLLLSDVTGQKKAQAQLLEQQRALAILHEREKLARELHDGIGQVLGYVKMQAQSARISLAQDQKADADRDLEKLVAVAQDAHADVREYILGAKLAASNQQGFLPTLRQYLQRFSEYYVVRSELLSQPDFSDEVLEPTVAAQLLRIIQEALTNVRKHARAQRVEVLIHLDGSRARVIVQDDGIGFDPASLLDGEGQKYGLGFLRERAEEVGGSVEIQSAPGQGTRVLIEVPLVKVQDKN